VGESTPFSESRRWRHGIVEAGGKMLKEIIGEKIRELV
jgi:hypothetical protein